MIFNAPFSPVALELGPLSIYWYGVIIASGMLIGYFIADREANRKGLPEGLFMDLMFYIIIASIVGARLYYVVFQWEYYSQNPLDIIMVNEGGMAIHGGLIGGFLAGIIYCRIKGFSFFQLADIAAPSLILGQAIGRWGNFMNQEAHGGEVSRSFLESLMLPEWIINQMYIDGAYYHPTFLYESVWNIIGFVLLILLRPKLKIGQTILLYLVYYSIGRFFIEGMRTDSLMIGESLRTAQFISILIIVAAAAVWIYREMKYKLPRYKDTEGVYKGR
ncbi:prolipoprotein diacylglyceryl transferase [Salinicoccus roseus]|jgi:phosphatidylglycerol:prolipoprotein diacylglycerol transferase|uniref:prolipoprotein diacylglyceryl transferase n=1 Tax=Salinicoccus roseus TaxID=45670 RepID=UPI000F4FAA18|nr:prolipoprotein diacylglyceryl transferase [Salinicoccus roseus]RPE55025.1 prolipoprotein diacylglyceryl transferase [Salinicoccus roseus]GGA60710.1 prolipoprotein diacylglyceryl transferase [Salinicoccus roseus]